MSGAHAKWTPERRKAQAERMRKQNADKAFAEKRIAKVKTSEYHKARMRAAMVAINHRRYSDPLVYQDWIEALSEATQKPKRLKHLRRQMTEISRRPHRRQASREFLIELNKNPDVRRKSIVTRRGGDIPDELLPLFKSIRPKVGLKEAMRIVAIEAARLPA